MTALTRFYYGAINPLTVEHYTLREIARYVRDMEIATAQSDA